MINVWELVLKPGKGSGDLSLDYVFNFPQHPGYKRASNFPNDIAMLQMDESVDVYGRDIRMACLPPVEKIKLFGHGNCWISGWGETRGKETSSWTFPKVCLDKI